MFVFALAVPGLLVVLVGYVLGYEVTAGLSRLVGGSFGAGTPVPELVGWLTGLLLLGLTCQQLWRWRRRVVRRRVGQHQK